MKINAEWTDDCQGKKDFDGQILSISTRYWPRGGGFTVLNREAGQPLKFEENEDRPELRPHTHSTIYLHGDNDDVALVETEVDGETLEEVQAKVEAFADEQFQKIVTAIREAFYVDPNGSPR